MKVKKILADPKLTAHLATLLAGDQFRRWRAASYLGIPMTFLARHERAIRNAAARLNPPKEPQMICNLRKPSRPQSTSSSPPVSSKKKK